MRHRWKVVIVALMAAFLGTFAAASNANAASTFQTVSGATTYVSILNIKIFTVGVAGDYYKDTSTKVQSNWSGARAQMATHYPGWSFNSAGASWVYKSNYSSQLRGWATFVYGLDTQWFKLHVKSNYMEINVILNT